MKQIVLNVDNSRYQFFMELVQSLDFVSIATVAGRKKEAIQHIAEGMLAAKRASEEKSSRARRKICSMCFEVPTTRPFEKEAKRLSGKYPSLKADLHALQSSLREDPDQGTFFGNYTNSTPNFLPPPAGRAIRSYSATRPAPQGLQRGIRFYRWREWLRFQAKVLTSNW